MFPLFYGSNPYPCSSLTYRGILILIKVYSYYIGMSRFGSIPFITVVDCKSLQAFVIGTPLNKIFVPRPNPLLLHINRSITRLKGTLHGPATTQSLLFLHHIQAYFIYSLLTKLSDRISVGITNSTTPIYPGATSYLSNEITSLPSVLT